MKKKIMSAVLIFGEIVDDPEIWKEWLDFCEKFASLPEGNVQYVGISGKDFDREKCLTYKYMKKKLFHALDEKMSFSSLSMYSVPTDFITLGFDSDIFFERTNCEWGSFILITLSKRIVKKEKINLKEIKNALLNFVNMEKGIIFEIDISNLPMVYKNILSHNHEFKTRKFIEKF